MKNFQVKHVQVQCDPKTFAFEGSKWLLDLHLADSRKSIHKFIIELHALLSLFVRGLIKNKGGVELIQIHKRTYFFISYGNQVPLGVIS